MRTIVAIGALVFVFSCAAPPVVPGGSADDAGAPDAGPDTADGSVWTDGGDWWLDGGADAGSADGGFFLDGGSSDSGVIGEGIDGGIPLPPLPR